MEKNRITRFGPGRKWVKTFLLMRLGVVFTFLFTFQMSGLAWSQRTALNISVREASLRDVIEMIKSQSDYTFVYDVEEVAAIRKVSLEVENTGVDEVLRRCLENTGFTYRIEEQVVIIKKGQQPEDKGQTIKGKVADPAGMYYRV